MYKSTKLIICSFSLWQLAFPKGLGAAAGRPRVPPSSPVIFDVNLVYIPGLSDLDEWDKAMAGMYNKIQGKVKLHIFFFLIFVQSNKSVVSWKAIKKKTLALLQEVNHSETL